MNELWDSYSDKSLSDILKKQKKRTGIETHVATLGRIKSITREFADGYGEAEIEPFPLYKGEDAYTIKGMFFSDNYSVSDIVLVVFTDFDFRTSVRNGFSQSTTQNTQTHSRAFGVIARI